MAVQLISTLSRGSTGAAVRKLQGYLHILGYLSNSDVAGVNGVNTFGPKTENAVKDVQQKYNIANGKNIPVNGVADFFTQTVIEWAANATPKRGATGSLVENSSIYLVWSGLLSTTKTTLDVEMEEAINRFQSANGLYQTGTLNTKTVTKLVSVQMNKIKAQQQQVIIKEVLNGEINHETRPIFGTGAVLLICGTILALRANKKKIMG